MAELAANNTNAPMPLDKVDNMREGEFVTSGQLRNEWTSVLSRYDLLINGGHKLTAVRFIVRHIN